MSLAALEGMFWSAPLNRYVLELWDTTGRLHRRYTRNVDWFEPWDHQPGITEDGPGNPQLQDIHEDRLGRLWVMVLVGDRRWRRSVEPYISEGRKFFRPTSWVLAGIGRVESLGLPSFMTVIGELRPQVAALILDRP